MPNREQRRQSKPKHAPAPQPGADLDRLIAEQPIAAPAVLDLNACRIQVVDAKTSDGAQKVILFRHVSGGFIAKCVMPPSLAREVATMLTAPAGIVIPNNGDNGGTP